MITNLLDTTIQLFEVSGEIPMNFLEIFIGILIGAVGITGLGIILYCLMEYVPVRFNEMQRYLKKVSDKTLSQNLKELEADNLIIRKVYPQIPPKVEYSLSKKGNSLMEILDQLCIWGEKNKQN